jgi:hypothetical protein
MSLFKARDLMTIRCMTIRYAGILASFDDPATAAVVLAPEIAARTEKDRKRQEQRHPGSVAGRGRGRPRLTEAEAVDGKERRREYMKNHMREKRALAKFWGAGFKTAWPEDRTSTREGKGQP